jgi:hypothetical protein
MAKKGISGNSITRKSSAKPAIDSEIVEKKNKKITHWVDEYKNPMEMKSVAVSEVTIERFAEDIVKWAHTPNALTISSFPTSRGIHHVTWNRWLKRFPLLMEANDIAKELIGIRREEGVMLGKYRDSMVKPIHGLYSHQWRENEDRLADLANESINPTMQVVVIPDMPRTDIVPELPKDTYFRPRDIENVVE